MARKVFFSFDWDDVWRVSQIRNMNIVQKENAEKLFTDKAKWEEVKRKGDIAIKNWIDNQMRGTSVTVVLIGRDTHMSRFVNYEIKQTIAHKKGLLGIHIHNIKDTNNPSPIKGQSPIPSGYMVYDPQPSVFLGYSSYDAIKKEIASWIEKAALEA
ncbi:MAG: TIR domain-containing protein [Alphaproteobacteria bacterium]|nr:TIR domain-containing protein [Alphaproteobacteria bacterium]